MLKYDKIALIPAYKPDEKLLETLRGLCENGFAAVVVDDGSGAEFSRIFNAAGEYAMIVPHDVNRGKGQALKTGIEFIRQRFAPPYTVVTADADGQHRLEDIIKVTNAAQHNRGGLVLGSRRLDGTAPLRSRLGNGITRWVFKHAAGVPVYDTQTGLRAFGSELAGFMLGIGGSRYEYETNVLLECARCGVNISEELIDAVYIDGNSSSHFNTVKDSYRIYKEIIMFRLNRKNERKGAKTDMKKLPYALCYTVVLTAFTAYITLDTFVLSSRYDTNAAGMNTAMFENIENTENTENNKLSAASEDENTVSAPSAESGEQSTESKRSRSGKKSSQRDEYTAQPRAETESEVSPATAQSTGSIGSYSDENISITLNEYYEYGTKIYVADVSVTSAQYLKTALADDTYGKNVTQKTSEMAEEHNAILAVNGDYYGVQERGYVIRNGIIYRSTPGSNQVLCIYADGTMQVYSPDEYTAEELLEQGVWQAFSFGPELLNEGNITVSETDEVGKAMASNPRTAIGILSPNHYVFVVSDGRTDESAGLSLYQLAAFMQSLGAEEAYNLDGGGSSTMYFQGEVINNPTTGGSKIKERGVSDIVYIG